MNPYDMELPYSFNAIGLVVLASIFQPTLTAQTTVNCGSVTASNGDYPIRSASVGT